MKRNHPNRNGGAWIAVIALAIGACGCGANQQTASINPFLSPDRVPPPATRTLLPGTAQPYYPGDPLPTMQSGTGSPAPAQPEIAVTRSAEERPRLASTNEVSVAIPADNGALRFAPRNLPVEPAPFTPAPSVAPIATAQASPSAFPVAQAAFNPWSNQPLTENAVTAAPTSPWRSPRVPVASPPTTNGVATNTSLALAPQPTMAPSAAAPFAPQSVTNWAPAPSTMDVRLRAVPSPPVEPVAPTTPRIRLPGAQFPPQAYVMPDGRNLQAGYTVSPNGAVVQAGGITAWPASLFGPAGTMGAAPTMASQTEGAMVASRDGFRPRGSMR